MKRIAALVWIQLVACLAGVARADVRLPAIFSDHMVWQRGMKAPIWGTADAGEKITVKILGQEATATADAAGKWRAVLGPIESADPIEVLVSGKNSVVIHDVLIGEVWLCSGQSNMAFKLKTAANSADAIKAADRPTLRLFWVDRRYNADVQPDVVGSWKVCTPAVAADFSAVAYFFATDLQKKLDVPIGLVESDWGGTRAEAWLPREAFDRLKLPYEPAWTETWLKPMKVDPTTTEPARKRPYEAPAAAYNGMIAPLAGFALRGMAWYQGETNTAYPKEYRAVLAGLIESWREAWGKGDFPFLVVQLPNFLGPTRDWVSLRASQAAVAKEVANVGLVVTIDVGDPHTIHPTNKQPVGRRLAAVAEKIAYGLDVVAAGPTFKALKIVGSEAIVSFDHADGLKTKGDTVEGFEIAAADGKFVAANARIDGSTVGLSADGVSAPAMARYGWANEIKCTLYNGADFPAEPFTSEAPASAKHTR